MPPPTISRRSAPVPSVRDRLRDWARDPRAWLVALAFLLRCSWVLLVPSRPVGDFALYREAAEHLLDQGHLDAEFVYMPGYVVLLAGINALGGGLLAAKLIGVAAGTCIAGAVGGIANVLFGRRAGIAATALAALWPAGIAVASVTGTDLPAAALVTLAIYALVRFAPGRPWLAAALCGLVFGVAAWVRAVAAPLAALSLLYWLAAGTRWPSALGRAGAAVAIAFLILLPWGLRNQRVYGEFFFTDSHGGHTALVGANPNSEGAYSRSLNVMFTRGTGYRLFEPPERHRQSDRVAYGLARSWTAFEPAYAAGLVVAKADRLLTHERNLLYWPVFRQGVLEPPRRAFFEAHRAAFERTVDMYWWLLAGLAAAGVAICAVRRGWLPLSILVFPLGLTGIYTLFFAEVRYHLAIAPLLIPHAACALDWAFSPRPTQPRAFREWRRTLLFTGGAVLALFAGWAAILATGKELRGRHRWAVAVCAYPRPAQTHLCKWRRVLPQTGDSPLRGTWDGVGLRVNRSSPRGVVAAARTEIPVSPGRFRVGAAISWPPRVASTQGLAVALRANGRIIGRTVSPAAVEPLALSVTGVVEITTTPLVLDIEVEPAGIGSNADAGTVWVSQLLVERF